METRCAIILTSSQVREALALLGWTSPTLARRALLTFDDVAKALDDIGIRHLGGLHLGAIRETLEVAGIEFNPENGGRVRVRKGEP